jgi:hypothetical protein
MTPDLAVLLDGNPNRAYVASDGVYVTAKSGEGCIG